MRIDNPKELHDEILGYRPEFDAPGARERLLETAWPRVLGTLELIPDEMRSGDVLELGAAPFFLTLCLRRLMRGRIVLGNYFGTPERSGKYRLIHRATGDEIWLEYDLFNVEAEDFPYPDASFDVVIFSELLEHLAVNPVRALSEIHRVLRPGGVLVVTTPNSLSQTRLESYLFGRDQMVDRYSPACGYGARHNREYHPAEVRELVEGTGFAVEEMRVCDLTPLRPLHRLHRALWRPLLAFYARHPREEHIFLRARRGHTFRWHFPPALFENIETFLLIRYPAVTMGINDAIQCGLGWQPLEDWGERGGWVRRIRGPVGQGFLKTPDGPRAFCAECFVPAGAGPPLRLRLVVWDRWLGRVRADCVYLDRSLELERGRWHHVKLPLENEQMRPGSEVEARFELKGEEDPRGGQELAVRKFWLAARCSADER